MKYEFDLSEIAAQVDYKPKTLSRGSHNTHPEDLAWICEQWWRRKKLPSLIQQLNATDRKSVRASISGEKLDPDNLRSILRFVSHNIPPEEVYKDLRERISRAARSAIMIATDESFFALRRKRPWYRRWF